MDDAPRSLPLSRTLVAVTGALAAASCVAFSIFWDLTGRPDWTVWTFVIGGCFALATGVAVFFLKGTARSALVAVTGAALLFGCCLLLWDPAAAVAKKFLGVSSPAILIAAAFAVVASGALRARAARPGLSMAGLLAAVASGAGILTLVILATVQKWHSGALLPTATFVLGLNSSMSFAVLGLFAGVLVALVLGAIAGAGGDRRGTMSWAAVVLGRLAFWGIPLLVAADALVSARTSAALQAAEICVALGLPLVWTAGYWTAAGLAALLLDVDDGRVRLASANETMRDLVRRYDAKEIVPEEFRAQRDALPLPKIYSAGTLRYTAFGLVIVFVYLCWGDFVFTLLDGQLPGIMPLKLKDIGASDQQMVFINRTLAYIIGFLFCPAVSFHSDRCRSRWGRRIPYLLWTTPFVGLFMVLIGCYTDVTQWFMGDRETVSLFWMHFSRAGVTLLVFAVLYIGFDLANVFVGSVWYYLFNDVVPSQFLSRILALFRMVGIVASMIYNKFIFAASLEHFRTVFIVGGIAYGVGFTIFALLIREGKYPPPPESAERRAGVIARFIAAVGTFFRECFSHRFYWYFFLMGMFEWLSWQSGVFNMPRNRDSLHLTLQQMGDIGFYVAPVSFILQYPAGWLADKYHPVRIYYYTAFFCCLSTVFQSVFIFTDFGACGNLVFMYVMSFMFLPLTAVRDAASGPMYMRVLPKDRYGQFCSANAMVRSLAITFVSVFAGVYMGYIGLLPARDYSIGTAGIEVRAEQKPEPGWTEEAVGPWTVRYSNNGDENGTVTVPGATAVRVFFGEVLTESAWDHLRTDASRPDDFTGAFDETWTGAKPGDTMSLRLTSGEYMTLGGRVVGRTAANLAREGVKTAQFTVTKVAYLGQKTGEITRAGALWEAEAPTRFALSGAVARSGGGVSGVTVSFAADNGQAAAPGPVVTDANGWWWQGGFDNSTRYRVSFAKKEVDGTWSFDAPKESFAKETAGIATEAARAASPDAAWTVIDVGDPPKRWALTAKVREWLASVGLAHEEKLEPWRIEYGNDWDRTGSITVPGAKAVKVLFEDIKTEPGWDSLSSDADIPDRWTGDFAADNTSVKTGDTVTLRVRSIHYARAQGTLVLRLPTNMLGARFKVMKVAYLGEKAGPVTRSGALWEPDTTYSLSGRVIAPSGAGLPGVTLLFERDSGSGEAPSAVVTDAAGNWNRTGFDSSAHYKVSASRAPSVAGENPWTFSRPTIGDWRYRYYTLWVIFFNVFQLIFMVLLYREWKKLGGAESYVPPAA